MDDFSPKKPNTGPGTRAGPAQTGVKTARSEPARYGNFWRTGQMWQSRVVASLYVPRGKAYLPRPKPDEINATARLRDATAQSKGWAKLQRPPPHASIVAASRPRRHPSYGKGRIHSDRRYCRTVLRPRQT